MKANIFFTVLALAYIISMILFVNELEKRSDQPTVNSNKIREENKVESQ